MRGHSKPVLWNNNTILLHNRLARRRLSAQVIHPKTIIEFRSSLFSFSSSQLALNFAYDESKIAIPTHQATLADVDEWWWSNSVRFPPLHTHSYVYLNRVLQIINRLPVRLNHFVSYLQCLLCLCYLVLLRNYRPI